MAYETGTATDHNDLFTKLIAFLKTNADLVAAGENWETAWQDSDSSDVVLRGPGLANQDQIYVGFRQFASSVWDAYWIELRGMTGVVPSGTTYSEHVNVSPSVRIFLDPDPMEYWFVASGRRFIVVLKISTVFEAAYAGLFLPYATPLSYGYPFFLGGSAGASGGAGNGGAADSWRSQAANHRHFVSPHYNGNPFYVSPGAWMLDPAGQWLGVSNNNAHNIGIAPEWAYDCFGRDPGAAFNYNMYHLRVNMREAFGGDFPLFPYQLVQRNPADQTYGVLDGCYLVPGLGNSSENIVTIDSVEHLVVQNVFRVTIGDYWALKLE